MTNSTVTADKAVAALDAVFANQVDERSNLVTVNDDYTPIMFTTMVSSKSGVSFLFVEAGNYQGTLFGDDITRFLNKVEGTDTFSSAPGKWLS